MLNNVEYYFEYSLVLSVTRCLIDYLLAKYCSRIKNNDKINYNFCAKNYLHFYRFQLKIKQKKHFYRSKFLYYVAIKSKTSFDTNMHNQSLPEIQIYMTDFLRIFKDISIKTIASFEDSGILYFRENKYLKLQ